MPPNIKQGEVFWVVLPPRRGSEPAERRPALILQTNRFNVSRINTVVVVAITSNLLLAELPGNVALDAGEAGLPKPSVSNVTQIATIDRAFLGDRIGAVSSERLRQVWAGVCLVLEPNLGLGLQP